MARDGLGLRARGHCPQHAVTIMGQRYFEGTALLLGEEQQR